MFMINRRASAAIVAVAGAVASTTTLFASPAQAATGVGAAQVLGWHNTIVRFTAAAGKANSLVITISGRTITLDDRVAIKPGKGCKAVKADRTKVKCTTSRKPTELSVTLGDKNDRVFNRTAVSMVVGGGSGHDTLVGGSNRDRLFGGDGNDKLYGGRDVDAIAGEEGNDTIYGGKGNDWLDGGDGNDIVLAGSGNDTVYGHDGNDWLRGGAGNDTIQGGYGNDAIAGGPGNDRITGGPGVDQISGGAGTDKITQ